MQYSVAALERNSFGDMCVGAEFTDVRDVIGVGMSVMSELALALYLETVQDCGGSWTSYLESAETVHGVPTGRCVLYLIRTDIGELTEVVLAR